MLPRDDAKFARSPDVVSRVLDGEAVLLDLASNKYLGLNEVATRVWELIGDARAFGEIRAALLGEFDVAADALDRDLERLFADLEDRQLIRRA